VDLTPVGIGKGDHLLDQLQALVPVVVVVGFLELVDVVFV
jgi:hypothetical protein